MNMLAKASAERHLGSDPGYHTISVFDSAIRRGIESRKSIPTETVGVLYRTECEGVTGQ